MCSLSLNVTGPNPANKLHLFACEMLSAAVYAEIRKAVEVSVQAETLKEYQLSVKVFSLKAFTFMFSKLNFMY